MITDMKPSPSLQGGENTASDSKEVENKNQVLVYVLPMQ